MISGVLILGVVGALIALIGRSFAKAKALRVTKLQLIAAFLGGEQDASSKAWGSRFGPKTTVELATRGSGSNAETWTHIHVELPAAYPLALHIRRHVGGDRQLVDRGKMVDVIVGDPAFDQAFLVEAAPADVVRELLDVELRGLIASYTDVDLETIEDGDGTRSFRIGIRPWLQEVDQVRRPVELMAKLGSRVRDAYAKADAAIEQPLAGDPYRPVVDARPVLEAQAAREAEVGKVKAMREGRAAKARVIAMMTLVLIGLITVLSMVCSAGR